MENKEHNLQDKRCECCGYMTYHREHMGCIRASEQAKQAEPVGHVTGEFAECGDILEFVVRAHGSLPPAGAKLYTEPPAVAVKHIVWTDGQLAADGYVNATAAAPHTASCLPSEMTPAMMRAVQMRSELGAYAAANLAGAYDLFAEFWRVAAEEVKKGDA